MDVRIRDLEAQLQLKEAQYEKLQEKVFYMEKEKFKREFQIENLQNDLSNIQQVRDEEQQQYNKLLDDQEITIDTLKNQLAIKESEIRKLMIMESNQKTSE